MLEQQQQLANLAELSNMNQAAATNMLGYSNPYNMMASLAGLGGGFPAMLAASGGMPGMTGLGGSEYQAALAAMTGGFPTAAGKRFLSACCSFWADWNWVVCFSLNCSCGYYFT